MKLLENTKTHQTHAVLHKGVWVSQRWPRRCVELSRSNVKYKLFFAMFYIVCFQTCMHAQRMCSVLTLLQCKQQWREVLVWRNLHNAKHSLTLFQICQEDWGNGSKMYVSFMRICLENCHARYKYSSDRDSAVVSKHMSYHCTTLKFAGQSVNSESWPQGR